MTDTVYVVSSYPAPGWDDWYDFTDVWFDNAEDAETLVNRVHEREWSAEYAEYLADAKLSYAESEEHNRKIDAANAALEAAGLEPTDQAKWSTHDPYDFKAWKRVYVRYPLLTWTAVKRGTL